MKNHLASKIPLRPSIRTVAGALLLMMTAPLWAAPPSQFTASIANGANTVSVDFTYHPIRGAGFQVLQQDATGALNPMTAPEARTYIGTVTGYPGASACALLQPDGTLWEYVVFEAGDQWWADNGTVTRTYGSKTFTPTWPTSAVVTPTQAATVNYVVAGDMIAEIPYNTFTGVHHGSVDHVVYVTEFCLMETNLIYLRDIGFLHRLSRVIIRGSQANDPFQTGNALTTLRGLDGPFVGHEALKFVAIPGYGGGVALLGTVGDFYSGVSVNDTDGRGDAFIYWRHEVGHNHGAGDGEGGYCENYTLMNANQVGRMAGPEEAKMIPSRHGGPNYGSDVMENMGTYSAFSLPPRASLDLAYAEPGTPVMVDVMANDHDSNADAISLLSFDSVSTRGGTLTRSVGTGPGGRDQIIYTGSNDFPYGLDNFQYRIQDATGRQALGNVYVKVALATTGELAAYWPLDESTGTAAIDDVGSADATLFNGASWVAGTINNGLSFNGVNQYAKATINIPETNTAVSFWFKTSQAGGGLYSVVDNGSGHDRHIYLNGGNIKARIYSEETIASTGQNYANDQWHQVVHTFGGVAGGQKLYVDGVLVASGTKTSSNFTTQTAIDLGYSASSPTQYFNGRLDDVRIWNRALTGAEALALAQRSGTANDPSPPYATIIGGSQSPALDWLAPTGTTSHDIYLGNYAGVRDATTASGEFQGNFSTLPFVTTITTPDTYYWRADERRDATVFKGSVWYFQYFGTNGSNAVNLTQPTAWWVDGSDTFTQTAVVNGTGSLYKDRTGTLVLTAADNFTGSTTVSQGVLTLGIGGSLPNTSAITIASGATLNLSGTANNELFSGTQTGTLTVSGTLAVTTNAANTLYCNNITLNNGTMSSSGGNGGQAATYGAFFVGANRTIVANGSNNVISGNGDLGVGGSAVLTLNTPLAGDSLVASTIIKSTGSVTKTGPGTVTLSGANTYTGITTLNDGVVSVATIGNGGVAGNLGKATNAAANWVFGGGTLQYTGATASTNHNFTLTTGTTNTLIVTTGGSNLTISGASTATTGALTKTGPGTLTLGGSNLHTGATTIGSGTLNVTGALSTGAVTVQSGATFGGTGTMAGAVTIQSGGTLAPGVNATGTLTINNTLTLAGTAAMEIGRTGAVLSTDRASGVTTLNYGGALVVTNIGSNALLDGDAFQLFSATTCTGTFSSITLPALSPGLVWETDNLSVNGSIRVGALPLAANDSFTIIKDTVGTFPVMANDSDPDGSALSLVSVTQGAHGTVAISGSNVTYTPASNYSGADSFTYTISDGNNGTAAATVSVTVSPVDDAPFFTANPITKAGAACFVVYGGSIAADAGDVDWGDTLTFAKVNGPAWLSVASDGALSGTPTDGDCGLNSFTVSVTDAAGVSATTTLQIMVTGVVWSNPGGGSWITTSNWTGGVIPSGVDKIANFATLNLTANATVTLDGARTIGSLTFGDTTPSHTWTLNTGSGGPLSLDVTSGSPRITVNNQTTTINVVLAGNDGLTKDGAGTLCLGASNILTGPFAIEGGIVRQTVNTTFAAGAALSVANAALEIRYGSYNTNWVDVASVTLGGGATLRAATQYQADNGDIGFKDNITVIGTNTVSATGGSYGKHNWLSGGMTGDSAAYVNLTGGSGYGVSGSGHAIILESAYGNWTGYQGTLRAVNDVTVKGTVDLRNAKVIVDGSIGLYANGSIGEFGELTGAGTLNANGKTGGEWIIGNLGTSTTYSGVINGASKLTKTGTGILTLTNASVHTGGTMVSVGILLSNNSAGSATGTGAVTVATGATLGGTGIISGATSVAGTLAPGGNAMSTLTINNTLTLTGAAVMRVGRTGAVLSSDKVAGVTTLTYGGALNVTDIGANALQAGDAFQLFSATTRSGSFSTIVLPALAAGLVWDTSRLAVDGFIQVNSDPSIVQSPYQTWTSTQGLDNSSGDSDNDGIPNLLEFFLNGNPQAADGSILPVVALNATQVTLTFKRRDDAEGYVGTEVVQWGSRLGDWTNVVLGASSTGPDANGVTVQVIENGAAADDITVSIPRALAVGGKLFTRLKVAE